MREVDTSGRMAARCLDERNWGGEDSKRIGGDDSLG